MWRKKKASTCNLTSRRRLRYRDRQKAVYITTTRHVDVASALIDETAACRPRITGRMVCSKRASPAPAWAVAWETKPRQTIDMHTARILGEVVIQISEGLQFVLNAYMAHSSTSSRH